MLSNSNVPDIIADVLLGDYLNIIYVDVDTFEYKCYSFAHDDSKKVVQSSGSDLFHSFTEDEDFKLYGEESLIPDDENRKKKFIESVKNGTMDDIKCRIRVEDRLLYCAIRLIKPVDEETGCFVLGVRNIDAEVHKDEEAKRTQAERDIFDQLAHSLASHYDTIYYVNITNDRYIEFSSSDKYESFRIPKVGEKFFDACAANCERIIYPDDQERVITYFDKKVILKTKGSKSAVRHEYKIMLEGKPQDVRYNLIWASDGEHIIICIENIEEEVKSRQKFKDSQLKSAVYANIAESLASRYDIIYYVNSHDSTYIEFNTNQSFDYIKLPKVSSNFFEEAERNAQALIHPKDRPRIVESLKKDFICSILDHKRQHVIDYRMLVAGKPQYTRMTISWANDRVNIIIGVENVDDEVKREKEQKLALEHANGLARRDALTGVKNKFAYQELEGTLQESIDSGSDYLPFAFLSCEIIGLGKVSDNEGKKAAEALICSASRLICNVFKHSPVFRIDGGRFIAFLGSSDYLYRDSLIARFHDQVVNNLKKNDGPVLAAGVAAYELSEDEKVADVLARADQNMIQDKNLLRTLRAQEKVPGNVITADDKRKLDVLFDAFSLVSDDCYIYICDMRYDFSKWSKKAVELFGLPSEYMYGAGEIWEEAVHPEDKDAYRSGIADIFTGNASGHDMQYRARKVNGEYDFCTCRGIVLRDENGKPEYFCGAIKNHSIQEHVDALTGLRNQYGFFDDLQETTSKHTSIRVYVISINKFSEVNEVYGYQFGNVVLQHFSRYLFEHVGNSGHLYRLDGTKFAVISQIRNPDEIRESYEKLRNYFRKGIVVDGKFVIIDLSAGLLSVDNFDIDYQTIYACLNFAYTESKVRRHGEMVEFYNDLNANNRYRLEMIYSIRASIMQNCKGFYLLYQPVVDAENEKLIGAEALLRWRSEEYGAVPPDSFIPILEKDPHFSELGRWILRTAIIGAKEIMKKNPDFIINVNLSYTQLEKPDFVDMVLRTLREEQFPPEHLCLEITERCRLLDMNLLKNVIVNLRGRGILIALDDFGTGFSSIGIMKNLPFDTIKIDRSFVRMIEQDQKERDLIKSFVTMAATFGAKICVEGVETAGMRDILQRYSIQSFQGYYYAKPLELDKFLEWKPENK